MSESRLADRIRNGSARVTVIGQGYVGLPLAVEFARAGFSTRAWIPTSIASPRSTPASRTRRTSTASS